MRRFDMAAMKTTTIKIRFSEAILYIWFMAMVVLVISAFGMFQKTTPQPQADASRITPTTDYKGVITDTPDNNITGTGEVNAELPEPGTIPALRPYVTAVRDNYIIAQNPETYITPDSAWVKYYASKLKILKDGTIVYRQNGTLGYKLFTNNYITDDENFNHPANGDYWQNADYYLKNGRKGDCEDWAIALSSILLSGGMVDSDNKQVTIPSRVVIGYVQRDLGTYEIIPDKNDIWVEYFYHNETIMSTTGLLNGYSMTYYLDKAKTGIAFREVFEFDSRGLRTYSSLREVLRKI